MAKRTPKKKNSRSIISKPNKTFIIIAVSVIALVALGAFLFFSKDQFVGKAISVNTARLELVSPAYTDQSFSLKILANTELEIDSVLFKLKLPGSMDCNYVAVDPVKSLIDGWDTVTNNCFGGEITFSAQRVAFSTGKSDLFEVAQIDIIKGLPSKSNVEFTFEYFRALRGGTNQVTLPASLTVTIQDQPQEPVCGNNNQESGEECDDGNNVNTDDCTNQCKNAMCGDSIVKTGAEQCDDGNNVNGDGCSSTCQVESNALCGDSICNVQFESTSTCAQDCGLVCPTNGLVSWWKGENNALDSYKEGHHGTLAGNAGHIPGIVGQAFKFDGKDDLLDLGSKAGTLFADPTDKSFSVSLWMKTAATKSPQGSMYIFDTGAGTEGRRGFYCNTVQGAIYCAVRQSAAIHKVSASNVIPLNSWKYVTLAFDDAGKQLKLYIDGALIKTGTEEQIAGETFASPQAIIGATNTKNLLFNGSLDEIAVWNRALSAAEINSMYDSGATGMCSITAFVCGNGIQEAGEDCDDNNNIDGDGCSSICQKESAICGDNVCEIKFESTTSCPQDCGLVCPTNGLVSWWTGKLNKESLGEDSFGNHHGVLGGDVQVIPGKVEDAFYFGGDGDYLALGQKPGTIFADPTDSDLSVSFWMRTNATKSPQGALYVLDSGAGTASRTGFYCSTNQGKLDCAIKHSDNIYQVSANNAVPLNVWKFVTFTFDDAKEELKLYVDGASVATGTKAALVSSSSPVPSSVIGATNLQTLSFNGTLDEVAVWSRVLASAEVKAIFDTDKIGMCAVPEAICGNGFIEKGEACDDGNLINTDACTSECKLAICGDGIIRSGIEQCDGNNLAGKSCQDLGSFVSGSLSCNPGCSFNTTACVEAPPTPPVTTLTVNGTKITLGEVTPVNGTFKTLLTATERFTSKTMIYTILYSADGKVLKLEADEVSGGMEKDAWVVITADHPTAEVKKKVVLVYDSETTPTVYGKLENTYS